MKTPSPVTRPNPREIFEDKTTLKWKKIALDKTQPIARRQKARMEWLALIRSRIDSLKNPNAELTPEGNIQYLLPFE
jgi:hypothetical protein